MNAMPAPRDPAARTFLTPSNTERPGDDPIFALNAEAKRRAAAGESIVNATLGALMDDSGRLAILPAVAAAVAAVDPRAAAAYAPIAGEPRFLAAVIADLFGGTALEPHAVAAATPGGTGALTMAVANFTEPGDAILAPSFFWGPYSTIAAHAGRRIETFEMFDGAGRFHVDAFARGLDRLLAAQGRALVFLNTPCNNPTGYSLDADEWSAVADAVARAAKQAPVQLLVDHAYARFSGPGGDAWIGTAARLVGSALLLVAWSASKAFAQYGARVGALVAVHPDARERDALRNAFAFSCRGVWSNCNHLGQLAIGGLLHDPVRKAQCDAERAGLVALLAERVAAFNEHARKVGLRYPRYEGGFFTSVFDEDAEAHARRMRDAGVYVVAMKGALRVALCSTPARDVPRLVAALGH